jgi:hypothetical protein
MTSLGRKAVMAKKRIIVVANKWWECDPIMFVLLSGYTQLTPALDWPGSLNHPHHRPDKTKPAPKLALPMPRATFTISNISVEIWCISDLLEHLPDKQEYQSSSEVKMGLLSRIFTGQEPDLVIAIGTTAFPGVAIFMG